MAITGEICGFEGGDETGCTGLGFETISTIATRTGAYGCRISSIASNQYGIQVGQGLGANFPSQTPHAGFCQFNVRFSGGPPSANGSMLCGFQDWMWMSVDQMGFGTLHCAGIGSISPITFGIPVTNLTAWFRVAMQIRAPGDGTQNRTCLCMISHYIPGTTTLDYISFTEMVAVNIGFTAVPPFTIGGISSNGAPATTWLFDVDDCVYAAASGTDLATSNNFVSYCLADLGSWTSGTSPLFYDQIWPVYVSAQGTHNDFSPAGRYDLVDEIPKGAGSVSSAVGETSYLNSGVSGAANATAVEAWTLRVNATALPAKSHYLTTLSSGIHTTYPVTIGSTSADSDAHSLVASAFFPTSLLGTLLPVGTFNNIEFGVENNDNTSTITIQNMYIEVLTGNPSLIPSGSPLNSDTLPFSTSARFIVAEGKGTPIFTEGPASPFQWGMQRLDLRLDIEEDIG